MKRTNFRHKLFIKHYTDISSKGFCNGAESYRLAGFKSANPDRKAHDLLKKPHIKSSISEIFKQMIGDSKEDAIAKTLRLHDEEKNPSVKARYWEMILKMSNYMSDKEIHNNTVVFTEAQQKLKSRFEKVTSKV